MWHIKFYSIMHFIKSYSVLRFRFAASAAMLVAVFLFSSCGRGRNAVTQHPAGKYRELLSRVRQMDTLSAGELACNLKVWMSLADSVSSVAMGDTLRIYSAAGDECRLLHDSLRMEFSRLALSSSRTFADILFIKEAVSPFAADSGLVAIAGLVRPFFDSLDKEAAVTGDRDVVLSRYRSVLASALADSIRSLSDLRTFIRDEDTAYRAFISRLDGLGNSDVSDIIRDTEHCCLLVAHAVDVGHIPYSEAAVYMAMRTGRRLLQNVRVCLDDIRQGRIRRKDQAWAYAGMLLQPYVSMDGLSIALLSSSHKDELLRMARETPDALYRLQQVLQAGGDRLPELPGMLLEIYIASL